MNKALLIISSLLLPSCIFDDSNIKLTNDFSYGWIDHEKASTVRYKNEGVVRAYCYDMLYNDTIVITKAHPRTIGEPDKSIVQYYIVNKNKLDRCPQLAYQNCVIGPLSKKEVISLIPVNLKMVELKRANRDGDYSVNKTTSTLSHFLDE